MKTNNQVLSQVIASCRSKVLLNAPLGAFCNTYGLIKIISLFKTFVLSILLWLLKTGLTVVLKVKVISGILGLSDIATSLLTKIL